MPIILEKWTALIDKALSSSGITSGFENTSAASIIAQSELERNNLKNLLIEGVIDRQKIRDKHQYVQVVQAMVIRLLDKLHEYNEVNSWDSVQQQVCDIFFLHLGEILNFIQDCFCSYFDRDEKVPVFYLLKSIRELRIQQQQLEQLSKLKRVDEKLIKIVVTNFDAFCSLLSFRPTYNQLFYQKDLMGELLLDNNLISEKSVTEVLFYFNFNDDEFVARVLDELKADCENVDSNREKIAILRYEQKNINQLRTRLNCTLSPSMPSLKEQVNCWIEEEIKFLQSEPSFYLPVKTETEPEDKIQTSLSVSKLALLIRLMVIDKIITNRVVAQVLRMVIRTVATAQSDNIGFSSFESKYHKTDKGTISAVTEMLFRWINILKKL